MVKPGNGWINPGATERPIAWRLILSEQITMGQQPVGSLNRVISTAIAEVSADRPKQFNGCRPTRHRSLAPVSATVPPRLERSRPPPQARSSGSSVSTSRSSAGRTPQVQQLPLKTSPAWIHPAAAPIQGGDQGIEDFGVWVVVHQHAVDQVHHANAIRLPSRSCCNARCTSSRCHAEQGQISSRLQQRHDLAPRQRVEAGKPSGLLALGQFTKDAVLTSQQADCLGRLGVVPASKAYSLSVTSATTG